MKNNKTESPTPQQNGPRHDLRLWATIVSIAVHIVQMIFSG